MATAVVEFNALTDAIRTATQDHHFALVATAADFRCAWQGDQGSVGLKLLERPLVSGVVVWRGGGKFRCSGMDGFKHGSDIKLVSIGTDAEFVGSGAPCNLTIGKTELLDL